MRNLLKITVLTLALATSSFAGGGGDILRATVMVDTLEYQYADTKTISWDTYAYAGYDLNKIYIYSEGEKEEGTSSHESENQLVFSHAIAPYWDVQFGLGYDRKDAENQKWAVLGVQGLAPYFFETRAVVLVGEDGNVGFRAETEYEALITQKLVLTPSAELTAYTKDTLNVEIGSGLSSLTLGLRLRYEIKREFAPYIGVEWSKNFGRTETLSHLDETYAVVGLRFWF